MLSNLNPESPLQGAAERETLRDHLRFHLSQTTSFSSLPIVGGWNVDRHLGTLLGSALGTPWTLTNMCTG
ncbi:hypothetical protein KPH14_006928 [Odynerus spinipes]|uniref:Uncharacterized protein n=1 Tax=Odynerus spinipes TaxID=1348599 RepID=A0AAD9RRE6_9HYME|nr:hypothetical protein KPH14_006928 [Odynerus spinipes]